MSVIDLRSDTLTRPDAAMRRAMAEAEVGDDVYGEDPTVRRLEEEGAAAMGFEAALYVPSGIMGNQIGLRLLIPRGTELLCDEQAHVILYEMGGAAVLWGIQVRTLASDDGLPALASFENAYSAPGGHPVASGGIALENTHNIRGGRAFSRQRIDPILAFARARGLPAHLDGARIWNAALALGTTPAELARGFDTVMFCLSKGLGAPVGSLLCASAMRIAEAREVRRLLGGAMRQAGVLAAAGLLALRDGPERLAADHRHAAALAEALAENPQLAFDPRTVDTNIVIFEVHGDGRGAPAARWVEEARAQGVLASAIDDQRVRLVTHRDVDDVAIGRAVEIVRRVRI
jgi:threonine aldolase